MNDIEAVAFDLDGTLYPNYRLNIRLAPFVLREWPLLLAFGRARAIIRAEQERAWWQGETGAGAEDPEGRFFYARQAKLCADFLGADPSLVQEKINRLIYLGWEPYFKKIRLFPRVRETLSAFKKAGLKLAMLSDFPPDTKLKYLGVGDCWDAVLCSECSGGLKPDPRPFEATASALGIAPEKILYVGNSFRYDVAGAKGAGMKAAWITRRTRAARMLSIQSVLGAVSSKTSPVDFAFHDYRQLCKYVLS
jgi:putative hydrolase of the HAD superfamily